MTCRQALLLLDDLLDGELSSPIAEQVRDHLAGCPGCRAEYEAARRLKDLLGQLPGYEPGDDYWAETEQLIRAKTIHREDAGKPPVKTRSRLRSTSHGGLVRSIVSLAASLFILFSAIMLSLSEPQQAARVNRSNAPILATASASELVGPDRVPLITNREQQQLAKGMLLLGPPSHLGRFTFLPDLTMAGRAQ